MVIVVLGLPGSGKSYFAKELATRLNVSYLATDVIRKEIFQTPVYTEKSKIIIYDELLKRAIHIVQTNKPVIVDGTFFKNELRKGFVLMAKKNKVPIYFIEIMVNEQLAKKRLEKPRVLSDADYKVYLQLKEKYEIIAEEHLTLNSENDVERMIDAAIEYLDRVGHDKQRNKYSH